MPSAGRLDLLREPFRQRDVLDDDLVVAEQVAGEFGRPAFLGESLALGEVAGVVRVEADGRWPVADQGQRAVDALTARQGEAAVVVAVLGSDHRCGLA